MIAHTSNVSLFLILMYFLMYRLFICFLTSDVFIFFSFCLGTSTMSETNLLLAGTQLLDKVVISLKEKKKEKAKERERQKDREREIEIERTLDLTLAGNSGW